VNYTVPSTATLPDAIYTEIIIGSSTPSQTMSGQVSALNDAIENAGYWITHFSAKLSTWAAKLSMWMQREHSNAAGSGKNPVE